MEPNLADLDDADLVRALDGDPTTRDGAMSEVLRRHRTAVIGFARRLIGDSGRAEEISQDVFTRLWERRERFDPAKGTLRAFLLALTHGRALDVRRSDTARSRRETATAGRSPLVEAGADAPVVARSVAEAVRTALGSLPEPERTPVELAYFGGHSYRVVAEMLGEPEGTVKSRIRTGLARLRTHLAAVDLAPG